MMTPEPEETLTFDAPPDRRGIGALLLVTLVLFVVVYQSLAHLSAENTGPIAETMVADISARVAVVAQKEQQPRLWRAAEKAYREALEAAPGDPDALRGLAASQAERGELKAAKETVSVDADVSGPEKTAWEAAQSAFGARPRPGPARMRELRAALADSRLGWSRHVALSRLADRPVDAQRHNDSLRREATGVVMRMTVAMLLIGVGLLVGLVLLLRYLSAPARERLQPLPVSAFGFMGIFFLALLGQTLVGPALVLPWVGRLSGAGETDKIVFAATAGSLVAFPFAAWGLRRQGQSLASLGWSTDGAFRWGVGGYLASLPLLTAALLLSGGLKALLPNAPNPANPAAMMALDASGWRLAMVMLAVVVAVPLTEELLFRGLMMRGLSRHFGTATGAVLTSVVFASLHPQLPFGFFNLFATGMVLAMVYRATNSLVPCFIVHALNNGAAMALMLAVR